MIAMLIANYRRLILCIVLCGSMEACLGPLPEEAGTPPPPADESAARPKNYDYSHRVLGPRNNAASIRRAVAILRFADDRSIDDLPFGPTTMPSASQQGEVNVSVNVGGGEEPRGNPQAPPLMNKRARDILRHALVESGAFVVIERERILEIIREINLGKTGYVDVRTRPPEGQLVSVRYLIEGSLGLNEDRTLKGTFDDEGTYRDLPSSPPGWVVNIYERDRVQPSDWTAVRRRIQARWYRERARRAFNVSCYLSAYDVYTGEVVTSVAGLGRNGLEAIRDAVDELTSALASSDRSVCVAAVAGDTVYLDVGAGAGLRVGDRFAIIGRGAPIRNRDGQIIGFEESDVGEIEVAEVKELMTVAKLTHKAGAVKRGDVARAAQR